MSSQANSVTSTNRTSTVYSPTSTYSSPTAISGPGINPSPAAQINPSPMAKLTSPQAIAAQAQAQTTAQVNKTLTTNSKQPFLTISLPNGSTVYAEYGRVVPATQYNSDIATASLNATLKANASAPFATITTPSGATIYAENGKQVSEAQFNSDLASYDLQQTVSQNAGQPFVTIRTPNGLIYTENGRQVTQTQFNADLLNYNLTRSEASASNSPFEELTIPSGPNNRVPTTIYLEYGKQVSQAKFDSDIAYANALTEKQNESIGYRQFNADALLYGPETAVVTTAPTGYRGISGTATRTGPALQRQVTVPFDQLSLGGEFDALTSSAASLQAEKANLNPASAAEVSRYNTSVSAYNTELGTYNANIASNTQVEATQQQSLRSLNGQTLTASQLAAYLAAAGIAEPTLTVNGKEMTLAQFAALYPNVKLQTKTTPEDLTNPLYSPVALLISSAPNSKVQATGSKSIVSDIEGDFNAFTSDISKAGSEIERIAPPAVSQAAGLIYTGLSDELQGVVQEFGYIGYVGTRPLALAEGKGLQTYNPSAGRTAGTIALEVAGAVGAGFVIGPAEAALGIGGEAATVTGASATVARVGLQALVGAGYGGITSGLTGGNVIEGAGLGAILFPATSVAIAAGAPIVSVLAGSARGGIGAAATYLGIDDVIDAASTRIMSIGGASYVQGLRSGASEAYSSVSSSTGSFLRQFALSDETVSAISYGAGRVGSAIEDVGGYFGRTYAQLSVESEPLLDFFGRTYTQLSVETEPLLDYFGSVRSSASQNFGSFGSSTSNFLRQFSVSITGGVPSQLSGPTDYLAGTASDIVGPVRGAAGYVSRTASEVVSPLSDFTGYLGRTASGLGSEFTESGFSDYLSGYGTGIRSAYSGFSDYLTATAYESTSPIRGATGYLADVIRPTDVNPSDSIVRYIIGTSTRELSGETPILSEYAVPEELGEPEFETTRGQTVSVEPSSEKVPVLPSQTSTLKEFLAQNPDANIGLQPSRGPYLSTIFVEETGGLTASGEPSLEVSALNEADLLESSLLSQEDLASFGGNTDDFLEGLQNKLPAKLPSAGDATKAANSLVRGGRLADVDLTERPPTQRATDVENLLAKYDESISGTTTTNVGAGQESVLIQTPEQEEEQFIEDLRDEFEKSTTSGTTTSYYDTAVKEAQEQAAYRASITRSIARGTSQSETDIYLTYPEGSNAPIRPQSQRVSSTQASGLGFLNMGSQSEFSLESSLGTSPTQTSILGRAAIQTSLLGLGSVSGTALGRIGIQGLDISTLQIQELNLDLATSTVQETELSLDLDLALVQGLQLTQAEMQEGVVAPLLDNLTETRRKRRLKPIFRASQNENRVAAEIGASFGDVGLALESDDQDFDSIIGFNGGLL